MTNNLKIQKEVLRAEAKRARGMMSLDSSEQKHLCDVFLEHIPLKKGSVISSYWPKGRELDTLPLMDRLIDADYIIALPVIEKGSRVLKFAHWHDGVDLTTGLFDVAHPVIGDNVEWLEPDVFILPLLAFDRQGNRLGYGGGYYDATLHEHAQNKDILAVGLAYAKQACLFNLPAEDHDMKMNWVVTEQGVQSF